MNLHYVDAGDKAGNDYVLARLTTDGAWHKLQLVPAFWPLDAELVHFLVKLRVTAGIGNFRMRTEDNVNAVNVAQAKTQAPGRELDTDFLCAPGPTGQIEYSANVAAWTLLTVIIRGWWIIV